MQTGFGFNLEKKSDIDLTHQKDQIWFGSTRNLGPDPKHQIGAITKPSPPSYDNMADKDLTSEIIITRRYING